MYAMIVPGVPGRKRRPAHHKLYHSFIIAMLGFTERACNEFITLIKQ